MTVFRAATLHFFRYFRGNKRVKLNVVKVVVSSEETCNNCLFVEVFNYFL